MKMLRCVYLEKDSQQRKTGHFWLDCPSKTAFEQNQPSCDVLYRSHEFSFFCSFINFPEDANIFGLSKTVIMSFVAFNILTQQN